MRRKILIATTNTGKFNEIMEILREAEDSFEFLTLNAVQIHGKPVENGKSYLENARIKAEFYNKASGLPVIAEDSGIEVASLKNELGMYTRRWGKGENASDTEWVEHFLNVMKKHSDKRASFKCTAYYIDENGAHHYFEGECPGLITETLEAQVREGIPLSSCFKAEGCDKVYSALQNEEKNKLSHRGKAMKKLLKHLKSEA